MSRGYRLQCTKCSRVEGHARAVPSELRKQVGALIEVEMLPIPSLLVEHVRRVELEGRLCEINTEVLAGLYVNIALLVAFQLMVLARIAAHENPSGV